MASLDNRQPQSLDGIVRSLELDIVLGRLKPNDRLVEDVLMSTFDVKRHMVRSALTELEQGGLVERRPHRGAIVRDYGAREVGDMYDLRRELHRLAVARMTLPLDAPVLEELAGLADAHEAAMRASALADVILHNDMFHDLLFDQCGNRILADTIHRLGAASRAIRSYRAGDPRLLRQAADEHRLMIEAAEKADRAALQELCERHIRPSLDLYLRDRQARASSSATPGGSSEGRTESR